ncbi:MAG: alpha/beta hydrolase [Phycisphaerales bacterium]
MEVIGLLILLGFGLALGWALLVVFTCRMLTRPVRRTYGWAVSRSLPGEPSELRLPGTREDDGLKWSSWSVRTGKSDYPVWDVEGLNREGPTVILTHGWGDSRVTMLGSGRVAAAIPLVSRLLLWDLPGHGEAPGSCSLGLKEPAALRAIIERVAERGRPVILWGFSLGARISINAARDNPSVLGVIAEAPYILPRTPALNVLRLRGLPYRTSLTPALWLISMMHRRLRGLAGSACALDPSTLAQPLLVIHGTADAVSPLDDGRTVASLAPSGRIAEIDRGRHQSLWLDPRTSEDAASVLACFLRDPQGTSPGGS